VPLKPWHVCDIKSEYIKGVSRIAFASVHAIYQELRGNFCIIRYLGEEDDNDDDDESISLWLRKKNPQLNMQE
jgi:hypothetical protein